MAEVMTYTSLVSSITIYAERDSDTQFIAQIPWMIMLAETRISDEFRGLGLQKSVTNSFTPAVSLIQKPDRWRETISWNFGTGGTPISASTLRNTLLERSYEYVRTYAPDPAVSDVPKYYADFNWTYWLVGPTPALAYPFEVMYYERPVPLDAVNSTNWTTQYAPNLLFYACMLETCLFLKIFDARQQAWQREYDRSAAALGLEKKKQTVDRSAVVDKE